MTARPRHQPLDDFFLDGDSLLRIFGIAAAAPPKAAAQAAEPADEPAPARVTLATAPEKAEGDNALRIDADGDAPAAVGVALGDQGGGVRLGALDALSFDFYLGSGASLAPTVRLTVDADGNLATTHDRVQLVFEYGGGTERGSWHSADLSGGDWLAWQHVDGANLNRGADTVALARWASAAGFAPAGGYRLDANSLVLDCAVIVQVEGAPGTVFIDNLQLGAVAYDFLTI